MKKLKLNVQRVENKTHINQIKKSFIYEINRNRLFMGKPVTYSNKYISDNDCWLKFVAGSNFNNPDRNINIRRVMRVLWLFQILDIFHKIGNPPDIYSNIVININPNSKHLIEINIPDYNYFIYIEAIYKLDETSNIDILSHYIILSSYSK